MSQFVFESDLQSVLKLDMPITNAPMPRWQRKASSSSGSGSTSANTSSLTPVKAGNKSLSTSKTPGKTPGKNTKVQNTPSKAGGDRYIPSRNKQQLEVASFLLSKENEPCNTTPTEKDHRKAWSMNLNGYDIDEAKILHLGGKPMNAPEGYQNNLKVLYSQKTTPVSTKKTTRYMSSVPDKILDAPEIRNDFYLNLIDWSSQNHVAVALHNNVYLWNAATGDIVLLMQVESEEHISSVSWIKEGNFLAVGVSDAKVQLWDVESQKRLRNMASHTSRVASLSWNNHVLSSGARSGHIHHHDVRVAEHHIATLSGHSQEVCGLKWSPDGKYLASGANDNLVYVWPNVQESRGSTPVHCFTQHQGAVKALAWCPWQTNILASGGGTSDRHIRIWNVSSGSCLSSLDTESQVCSLVFAPNYKELVSGHGYAQNQLVLWKYPSMVKVAELRGHQGRVLNLALSPDGSTIVSAAADETLRFWKCCAVDPAKKERTATKSTSIIHQGIR